MEKYYELTGETKEIFGVTLIAPVQWNDLEYEFDIVLDINRSHMATASFTLSYTDKTLADCKTYSELVEYTKIKGYKPGFAYYKGRELGLI